MLADRFPILTKSLVDSRRSLLLWAIGLVVVVSLYVPVYSRYQQSGGLTAQANALPEGMRKALGLDQIASPSGYLQTSVFGLLGILLLLVFAIGHGTRAIAGDEEAGTLDLYLAHPVSRRRLLLERSVALAVGVHALALVVGVSVWAWVRVTDMAVTLPSILAATWGLALLATAFGVLAITFGAFVPGRAAALGSTAAVATATYLCHVLAPNVELVSGLQFASPFHWYLAAEQVRLGADWGVLALLAALSVLLVAFAAAAFDRRDLGT